MITIALQARFMLHGCHSLKDKRRRLRGLRDRFGKQVGLAVCESGAADSLRSAQWTFVAVAGNATVAEQMLDEVERYLKISVDAELVSLQRRELVASSKAGLHSSGSDDPDMPEMPEMRS